MVPGLERVGPLLKSNLYLRESQESAQRIRPVPWGTRASPGVVSGWQGMGSIGASLGPPNLVTRIIRMPHNMRFVPRFCERVPDRNRRGAG